MPYRACAELAPRPVKRRLSDECQATFRRACKNYLQRALSSCLLSLIIPLLLFSWSDYLATVITPLHQTSAQTCFFSRPASLLPCWPRKCLCWGGKWVACDLTAFIRRAVHATTATTVLPHLAYNGPHSVGQSVVGVHVPTTIAPAVMLPNWQGNELRLHKRAPIGMSELTGLAVAKPSIALTKEGQTLRKRQSIWKRGTS